MESTGFKMGPFELMDFIGNDINFKSFKTESGWTGEKTPQGVIIFTSVINIILLV